MSRIRAVSLHILGLTAIFQSAAVAFVYPQTYQKTAASRTTLCSGPLSQLDWLPGIKQTVWVRFILDPKKPENPTAIQVGLSAIVGDVTKKFADEVGLRPGLFDAFGPVAESDDYTKYPLDVYRKIPATSGQNFIVVTVGSSNANEQVPNNRRVIIVATGSIFLAGFGIGDRFGPLLESNKLEAATKHSKTIDVGEHLPEASKQKLRSFSTFGVANRLFGFSYFGYQKKPVVAVIRGRSVDARNAILDNIDEILHMQGEVLIIKASFGRGQPLSDDIFMGQYEYQPGSTCSRLFANLEIGGCVYTSNFIDIRGYKVIAVLARKALQEMHTRNKKRIAFVVEDVSALCDGRMDDRPVMNVAKDLSLLMEHVAKLNASQTRGIIEESNLTDADVVANAFMTASPYFGYVVPETERRIQMFDMI